MKKIMITGGHLTPALALIEELQNNSVRVIFLGRKHPTEGSKNFSREFVEIRQKNIEFLSLITGRLQRKFTRYTFVSLLKIPIGFLQSIYFILKVRPNVVVSFGGYLSTPVIFAAWLAGIPSITHEQASKAGLANKINSLFVRDFLSAWQLAEIGGEKVIGNPTRKAIFVKGGKDLALGKFLDTKDKLIYVTGGNLGSHYINKVVFTAARGINNFKILHQIGTANYALDHQSAKKIKKTNYLAIPYIENDDVGSVLEKAHIVVSRSGANTIWEIATLKKVAILVPLPISAAKEQEENAKILENAGSAIVIKQEDFNPKSLMEALNKIEKSYSTYETNAQKFSNSLNRDAAAKMKKMILNYINNA